MNIKFKTGQFIWSSLWSHRNILENTVKSLTDNIISLFRTQIRFFVVSLQPESKNPSKVDGRGARVFARAEIIPVKPDSDNTDVGITDTDKQRIVVKRYW